MEFTLFSIPCWRLDSKTEIGQIGRAGRLVPPFQNISCEKTTCPTCSPITHELQSYWLLDFLKILHWMCSPDAHRKLLQALLGKMSRDRMSPKMSFQRHDFYKFWHLQISCSIWSVCEICRNSIFSTSFQLLLDCFDLILHSLGFGIEVFRMAMVEWVWLSLSTICSDGSWWSCCSFWVQILVCLAQEVS